MKRLFSPAFFVACIVLAAGILSLRGAVRAMGWALRKKPIPLRRELTAIPPRLGPYELLRDERLSKEGEAKLKTARYISRTYRDVRRKPEEPGSALWLHVVYFTGTEETMWVRHVPEICYVGVGYREVDVRQKEIRTEAPVASAAGGAPTPGTELKPSASGRRIPVRVFQFLPPGQGEPASTVYFFVANGRFVASKRGLRLLMVDMSARYSYYAKVEVLPGRLLSGARPDAPAQFAGGVADAGLTLELCSSFLSHALPEVLACLPDWDEVRAGRYPAAGAAGPATTDRAPLPGREGARR